MIQTEPAHQNILSSVVGHLKTIHSLLKLIQSKRVPHAFLFVGPQGQGQKKVALGFAQTLLCAKAEGHSPEDLVSACGVCSSCIGVTKGQNVGLHILEPEKGVIKIDSARAILRQLSLATWGRARVVIIDDAHLMNTQAANALLKSIEEPPAQTFYILISPSQDSVMKTIRSRTQLVRFRELSTQEKSTLQGDTAGAVSEFSQAATNIMLSVARRESSAAIVSCRELIENRELGLAMTQHWLTLVRNEWHQNTWGVSREILSQWSLLILGVERDLQGHCDLQLTFENGIHEMANSI